MKTVIIVTYDVCDDIIKNKEILNSFRISLFSSQSIDFISLSTTILKTVMWQIKNQDQATCTRNQKTCKKHKNILSSRLLAIHLTEKKNKNNTGESHVILAILKSVY